MSDMRPWSVVSSGRIGRIGPIGPILTTDHRLLTKDAYRTFKAQ